MTYECSGGHEITTAGQTIDACPMYVRGERCGGMLTAVGDGSQAENRRLRAPAVPA